jgi:predicted RNA-binding Zn-ribbon protein involved in translation (DUF1610 family)
MTALRIEFHAGTLWFVCDACGEYSKEQLGLKCPNCGAKFRRIKLIRENGEILERGPDEPPNFLDTNFLMCGMISQKFRRVGQWYLV